ncbi:hypothetical protein AB3S75_014842 [Citrus x aurantiifolia]
MEMNQLGIRRESCFTQLKPLYESIFDFNFQGRSQEYDRRPIFLTSFCRIICPGWEGVGVSSYLLIHFRLTRLQAHKAVVKAMVVNQVGGFGLDLAIIIQTFNQNW